MCGILGFSHITKRPPAGVLSCALHDLRHRGPNQQGQFVSDDVSLGAARLRILDLEDGDQPLLSPDGDVVLVFNGEIFNHRELRSLLENDGHRFESRCDTEVVLQAFLRWGTSCFSRMRGMFALAVWVQSQQRLILVRDRMGIKPLYYCLQDGEIYFGSELKVILAHPDIRRSICLEGLNCFLSLNYVPGPYTLVDGIVKLLPGQMLNWTPGSCEVRSYLPSEPPAAPPSSLDEACEELDQLLAESVKEQLIADVPVGIWLSGGLDSSTVLHYAAATNVRALRTFSITFQGHSFDESDYMKEVSEYYGTQHSDFDLNPRADLVGAIEQIAYHSDEPSADAGALPVWFLAHMTGKQVTVVLTGEGADELFAGYLTYQADRYASIVRKLPVALRKAALHAARFLPATDDKISFEYKLKRFLQGSLLSPEFAHVFWNGTFSEVEKTQFFEFADARPLSAVLAHMQPGSGLQRYLAFDQHYYLPDDILYKVDRMSMAHSLEARPPFLDPRVVDFSARLPEGFKLRGSQTKYVLRRLMQNKVPAAVLRRPKIGFDIPIHQWFRGVLRPFLLDTLSQQAVLDTGLFRWSYIEHLLHEHLAKRANLGYHLWGLMVLLIWLRRWNITLPRPENRTPFALVEPAGQVGSSSRQLASSTS